MLYDIIFAQKKEFEQKQREKYVHRTVIEAGGIEDIRIIIGPRKSGKAFLGIYQISGDSVIGYLSFEDIQMEEYQDFNQVLEILVKVYPGVKTLIIDEIQYLSNWEIIANRLQRKGYRLIFTTSNANLLSDRTISRLSSRHIPIYLFTFSFGEILALNEQELSDEEKMDIFEDYIRKGGYPEPMLKNLDHKEYILTLFDSIVFRDIIKRYGVRYPSVLENLANWLINNTGKPFSLQHITRQFQISSVHTIKNYLKYLEEVFIVFTLSRYSMKEKEIARTNKKVYCFDNGFITAKSIITTGSQDRLYENTIAVELYRRCKRIGDEIYFWQDRNHEKIDFVITSNGDVTQLLQVCPDIANQELFSFKVRSLLKASQKLNCTNLIIITREIKDKKTFSWFGVKETIHLIPAWNWMTH